MSVPFDPRLHAELSRQPYPLLFTTISGAHLYGFASGDSDYDLRGVHLLPPRELFALDDARETVESTEIRDGLEIDLVTHDAKKFFLMLLKPNGYVLEQVFSPLVLVGPPELEELKALAANCVTKHHAHHYLGFARNQWDLFAKDSPPRVKPLLYVFRVLLTGIHLMRTGKVESNLAVLNDEFRLGFVNELIARKRGGKEKETLPSADLELFAAEKERLLKVLAEARDASTLPEAPSARRGLSDLLVRLRFREEQSHG